MWSAAWLLGPGFALGAGSQVTPAGTLLGPEVARMFFAACPSWPHGGRAEHFTAPLRSEVPALLPPGVNSAFDYRMDPIPAVGQHNASILAELGWSAKQIAALAAA